MQPRQSCSQRSHDSDAHTHGSDDDFGPLKTIEDYEQFIVSLKKDSEKNKVVSLCFVDTYVIGELTYMFSMLQFRWSYSVNRSRV